MSDLVQVANMPYQSSMKFEDMFVCDPSAKHMGFKSWDGMAAPPFFTHKESPLILQHKALRHV